MGGRPGWTQRPRTGVVRRGQRPSPQRDPRDPHGAAGVGAGVARRATVAAPGGRPEADHEEGRQAVLHPVRLSPLLGPEPPHRHHHHRRRGRAGPGAARHRARDRRGPCRAPAGRTGSEQHPRRPLRPPHAPTHRAAVRVRARRPSGSSSPWARSPSSSWSVLPPLESPSSAPRSGPVHPGCCPRPPSWRLLRLRQWPLTWSGHRRADSSRKSGTVSGSSMAGSPRVGSTRW